MAIPLEWGKGKTTKDLFDFKMDKAMGFTRKHGGGSKSNFAILPKKKNDKTSKCTKDKNSFPDHQITWTNDYVEFNNNYVFSNMNSLNNMKTVRGSMRVSANMDIEELLEEVGVHLWSYFKVSLRVKGVQLVKTIPTQLLMGVSVKMGPNTVKKTTDMVIKEVEGDTSNEWIKYSVYVGWPGGMPYTERKPGEPTEDSGRQAFIYQVDAREYQRFSQLLNAAKESHALCDILGERVFTMEMVPTFRKTKPPELEDKKKLYQKAA